MPILQAKQRQEIEHGTIPHGRIVSDPDIMTGKRFAADYPRNEDIQFGRREPA